MATFGVDLNIGAIVLFSCYVLLGLYLMTIVLQRITYTLKSPLSLTLARFMLFFMILIWCLTNLLYLYSCFIDTKTAKTNTYYKYGFYIEFYFYNIVWSLSIIFMAFSFKFKRDAPHYRLNNIKQHTSNQHPSVDIDDKNCGYDRDAPPPDPDHVRQQRQLHIDEVDLSLKPKDAAQSQKPSKKLMALDVEVKQNDEAKHEHPKYQEAYSNSKETQSFTFAKPDTVYDHNKTHLNMGFFLLHVYVLGIGSLTFTVIWYAVHFKQYNNLFSYQDDWLMPIWQFPWDHYKNDTATLVIRGLLSILLLVQGWYLLKEFYNKKVFPLITIVLVIYWVSYALFVANNFLDSHGHNIFLFVYPGLYYVIFLCLHIADADRDEQPSSQSVIVNTDKLEMFYSFWAAKPYKTCIAPNIFCFGPSPRILNPTKSSIILLGGWSNLKEDYNHIAHLLSRCGRNVIVIDYRGVGETGLGPNTNHDFYTGEQYGNDIMGLIKQLFPLSKTENKKKIEIEKKNEYDTDSSDYDSKDEFNRNIDSIHDKGHKVWIIGLSMGGNVALQCALHADANKYIRGIAICSGHGGDYLLQKGENFDFYGNQILTGNALHYGWCAAQKSYIQYSHSDTYRQSLFHRGQLRFFYSWRLSAHPYYCCNFSKSMKNVRDKKRKKPIGKEPDPVIRRGLSGWFSNLSLSIRGDIHGKHAIVEGIDRQTDIAEEGCNIARVIHNISIPTLICYGKQDTIIHYKTAELLKKGIGENAWNEEFEFGGHNFWFENTDDFVCRIQDWMNTEEDYDQGNDDII